MERHNKFWLAFGHKTRKVEDEIRALERRIEKKTGVQIGVVMAVATLTHPSVNFSVNAGTKERIDKSV